MYNQEISFSSQSLFFSSTIDSSGQISGSSGSSLPAASIPASIPDAVQTSSDQTGQSNIFDGHDQYVSSESSIEPDKGINTIDTADIASLKAQADKQFEHFRKLVDSFISRQVRSFQFSASIEYSASYSVSRSSSATLNTGSAVSGLYDASARLSSMPGSASSIPMSFLDSSGLIEINHKEYYQIQESLKIDFHIEAEFDLSIDPATQQEAAELVSEEGEWGAAKTSERILEFAKALSGGDSSKMELMKQAFIDGFNQVKDLFGGELPEVSENTYELVMKGFEE
jgi:hypothetical protein